MITDEQLAYLRKALSNAQSNLAYCEKLIATNNGLNSTDRAYYARSLVTYQTQVGAYEFALECVEQALKEVVP